MEFKTIEDIGFKAFIDRIQNYSGVSQKSTVNGMGDDAAVISNPGSEFYTILSSEIFLEGVHFDLTYHPFKHLGYKIVTAAVSDVYAMNGIPEQLLINIALPNAYSVQMMEQLFEGVESACRDYDIELVGGDTTASHQILSLSVTAIGKAHIDHLTYRRGARHEDLICVTGDLGGAIAGLRILMREKKEWQSSQGSQFQPDLANYEYVIKRQLVPAAKTNLIEIFHKENLKPTSMIDVTQGLVPDLISLASASGLGSEIYLPAIPIALETRRVADEMKEDVDKYAFYGGEDYEMFFTIGESEIPALEDKFKDFSVIGRMTNEYKKLKINTGEDKTIEIDIE